MTNTQQKAKDVASPADRFWYQVIWRLGSLQEVIFRERLKQPVWRSFNGTTHTPESIDDKYLYNLVQLCLREHAAGAPLPPEFPAFRDELARRKGTSKVQALENRFTKEVRYVQPNAADVQLAAERLLVTAKARAAAAALPEHDGCMLCGWNPQDQPNQLRPWIPDQPKTLRCIEAKACQSRMINNKLVLLVERLP